MTRTKGKPRGTRRSCTCDRCQEACTKKPGWFLPGEIERVAAVLGETVEAVFQTALAVDSYETKHQPLTFVLSPAITTSPAGQEFPGNPHGQCVFFHEGRCTIHAVKPFQCREMLHSQGFLAGPHRNARVARAWSGQQDQIRALLGRDPVQMPWP